MTKPKFEIVNDKVRIRDDAARQWLVYVDGTLRAECRAEQSAKDFVAIQKAKSAGEDCNHTWGGTAVDGSPICIKCGTPRP